MRILKLAVLLGTALVLRSDSLSVAQPLLREGDAEAEQQQVEPAPDEADRGQLARQKARLKEERRLKLQTELMRLRGEQTDAERQEKERSERMMRYALWIAVGVIAATLLIAYARSRTNEAQQHPRPD